MNTISMATDHGTLSWTPVTEPGVADPTRHDTSHLVCGGYLFGPTALVNHVLDLLSDFGPKTVKVNYWASYTFTPDKDTLADVAAAFVTAGQGRGVLSEEGWEILEEAMPELVDPENNREDVIY